MNPFPSIRPDFFVYLPMRFSLLFFLALFSLMPKGFSQKRIPFFSFPSSGYCGVKEIQSIGNHSFVIAGNLQDSVWFGKNRDRLLVGSGNQNRAFCGKFQENGDFDWLLSLGVDSVSVSWALEMDSEGNFYWTGDFCGQWTEAGWQLDARKKWGTFLVKISPEGEVLWRKGFVTEGICQPTDIAVFQGDVFLAIHFKGELELPGLEPSRGVSQGEKDLVLLRISPDGQLVCAPTYGNPYDQWWGKLAVSEGYLFGALQSILPLGLGIGPDSVGPKGNGSDLILGQWNPSGKVEAKHEFGGGQWAWTWALEEDGEGGVVFGGLGSAPLRIGKELYPLPNKISGTPFLVRYASSLEPLWVVPILSSHTSLVWDLELDGDRIWAAGSWTGTLTPDPVGNPGRTEECKGEGDMFLASYALSDGRLLSFFPIRSQGHAGWPQALTLTRRKVWLGANMAGDLEVQSPKGKKALVPWRGKSEIVLLGFPRR